MYARPSPRWIAITLILGAVLGAARADAGIFERHDEGWWRFEASAVAGAHTKQDRGGDYFFTASAEYEWPFFKGDNVTQGVRAYPLFLYHQESDSETIAGAAVGIACRVYRNDNTYDGLFAEVGGSVLWHSRRLRANTSRVNVLAEAGIGYEFPNTGWHAAIKYEHISNGGLGNRNSGMNGVALAVGYRF